MQNLVNEGLIGNWEMTFTALDIAKIASEQAFGLKLVTNVARGLIVEAIISTELCPAWTWCSADYKPYDFIHQDGCRLEVKQSAAKQSWPPWKVPSRAQWDIRSKSGYFDGPVFIAQPGRNADIYVLAHHPLFDETVDHRDPTQWSFFVINTSDLPDADTIGLSTLLRRSHLKVGVEGLAAAVDSLRLAFAA